jgi:hypothetical protein
MVKLAQSVPGAQGLPEAVATVSVAEDWLELGSSGMVTVSPSKGLWAVALYDGTMKDGCNGREVGRKAIFFRDLGGTKVTSSGVLRCLIAY